MRYDYFCHNCSTDEVMFVFEVTHGMNEKPKIKCPSCNKIKTEKAFLTTPSTYVRGYGWLDKKGCRRDMNLFKLQNEDPYGGMREDGEADDLAHRLKKGGKYNPKRQYFGTGTPKKKAKAK